MDHWRLWEKVVKAAIPRYLTVCKVKAQFATVTSWSSSVSALPGSGARMCSQWLTMTWTVKTTPQFCWIGRGNGKLRRMNKKNKNCSNPQSCWISCSIYLPDWMRMFAQSNLGQNNMVKMPPTLRNSSNMTKFQIVWGSLLSQTRLKTTWLKCLLLWVHLASSNMIEVWMSYSIYFPDWMRKFAQSNLGQNNMVKMPLTLSSSCIFQHDWSLDELFNLLPRLYEEVCSVKFGSEQQG